MQASKINNKSLKQAGAELGQAQLKLLLLLIEQTSSGTKA